MTALMIALEILGLIAAVCAALYGSVMMVHGLAKIWSHFDGWRQRNHPVEKLLRHALGLMKNHPDDFTAKHDIAINVYGETHRISASTSRLKINAENLPLNSWQEMRLKTAVERLYAVKGGTEKQFLPLWLEVSGAKIIPIKFRKRA